MGKADVQRLHGSATKNFVWGMVTGAVLLAVVQSCDATSTNNHPKTNKPSPSATSTVNR
jgi:hypothetical protein